MMEQVSGMENSLSSGSSSCTYSDSDCCEGESEETFVGIKPEEEEDKREEVNEKSKETIEKREEAHEERKNVHEERKEVHEERKDVHEERKDVHEERKDVHEELEDAWEKREKEDVGKVSSTTKTSVEEELSNYGSSTAPEENVYSEGSTVLENGESLYDPGEDGYMEGSETTKRSITEEMPKKSIFVHSSPTHFPDIVKARKSAFGSIFVKAPVAKEFGSISSRKTGIGSQFNMIPAILDGMEKDSFSCDGEKRSTLTGSIYRAFEKRGLAKDVSASTTSQWDVYPIVKSALFSFHINAGVHHTRNLYRIEERIMTAPVQVLKFAHTWPTGSTWTGHWDGLGMAGAGTYIMPHDVCYIGKMQDGVWHDSDATLFYPNGFKAVHCNYVNGELTDYQFQFPDYLSHEKKKWDYCQYPDRRFWSEIQNGLKPAKTAQKTPEDPPRKIPENFYDTNDGFYDPRTKMLLDEEGKLLRIPTEKEEEWIKSKCRKGFHQVTGFSPELYENWYDDDKEFIQSVAQAQNKYFAGEITYEELYEFYADHNLLPNCSPYKKSKTSSEVDVENITGGGPKKLAYRLEKRYEGHAIPPGETSAGTPRKPRKSMKRSQVLSEKKVEKNLSQEKLSWKIKFTEGKKTPTVSTANTSMEGKDSRPILKKGKLPEDALKRKGTKPYPFGSLDSFTSDAISDSSIYRRKLLQKNMADIIIEIVDGILLEEREKHRDRLARTQTLFNSSFGPRDNKESCVRELEKLYSSMSDKEEFSDSQPQHTCDLRKLAQDKFQTIKLWGKKTFHLSFDEKKREGNF